MDSNFWELKNKEKICCFDIDGVLLSQYPQCWIDFVNKNLNARYYDLHDMKSHVSYNTYRKLKEKYRTCGIKEKLKIDKYAKNVIDELVKLKFTIVIMTARPADKYPTIYTQTLNWLRNNKIHFDLIYFGEKNKHSKILSELPHIKFVVEDNSYTANCISKWNYTVFLMTNKYNKNVVLEKNVIRIDNLKDILKYVKKSNGEKNEK